MATLTRVRKLPQKAPDGAILAAVRIVDQPQGQEVVDYGCTDIIIQTASSRRARPPPRPTDATADDAYNR